MADLPRIGIFDSGVGGLSVLAAIHQVLPDVGLHYVADAGHAPYGERDDGHVLERSMVIADHLAHCGAGLLVVACNTATAVAVETLRLRWPGIPIVGVEPGVKPAIELTRNQRIGVMATRSTLASARFARLLSTHADKSNTQVFVQACDGLAAAIELGQRASIEVANLVGLYAQPLRDLHVDTVVLGCTHYPFARKTIQAAFGSEVRLVDTSAAVARQVSRLWRGLNHRRLPADRSPEVLLQTTGDVESLEHFARTWLPKKGDPLAVTQLR